MKKAFLFFLAVPGLGVLHAHEHMEVGCASSAPAQLALAGPSYQVATYVPRGVALSAYLPDFPGGYHAAQLTFTMETSVLQPADGADPRIEIVSVSGPSGGVFAFWEVAAVGPTVLLPTGWAGATAAFPVIYQGDTHVHGRCFTMDLPGTYSVTFRAVDNTGHFAPSARKTVTFVAQQPPQLSLAVSGANAALSFTSRPNFVYDLQVCTDPASGLWTDVEPYLFMDGDGSKLEMNEPTGGRPRAFYRLVEYY